MVWILCVRDKLSKVKRVSASDWRGAMIVQAEAEDCGIVSSMLESQTCGLIIDFVYPLFPVLPLSKNIGSFLFESFDRNGPIFVHPESDNVSWMVIIDRMHFLNLLGGVEKKSDVWHKVVKIISLLETCNYENLVIVVDEELYVSEDDLAEPESGTTKGVLGWFR